MTKLKSIRRKLILYISVPIFFLFVFVGGLSLLSAYDEIEEVYDAQLAHAAKVLLQLTEHEVGEHKRYEIELGNERDEQVHRYEKKLTFRIWKNDFIVTQSQLAKKFGNFKAPPGYSDQIISGVSWRFFLYKDKLTNIDIEVAENTEVRQELILKILAGFLAPLSLFIPILLLIIWLGVKASLEPIVRLSNSVDKRDANDLSPIEVAQASSEIYPLVRALNNLFIRMGESFERERQFTDNAAHELRTPLAAMKTQTQVLIKKIGDKIEYKEGLDNLHSSIDRASHMIEQLLSFARLQADKIEFKRLNFSNLVNETITDISSTVKRKNIIITTNIEPDVCVVGNRNALMIMLNNLIDNAIKFSNKDGMIWIFLNCNDKTAFLNVSDNGPGIEDSNKERVFERFFRVHLGSKHGSGLGLSIVKWVCDIHHAIIKLEDNMPQGLRVQIEIPISQL